MAAADGVAIKGKGPRNECRGSFRDVDWRTPSQRFRKSHLAASESQLNSSRREMLCTRNYGGEGQVAHLSLWTERLQLEVRSRRRLIEIKEIEREIRTGVSPTRSAGTSPVPGAVRGASAHKAQAPPIFKGTSLKELRDF